MVRILTVLFVSSVFVFGFCKGNTIKEQLENDIKRTREQRSAVINENDAIRREIQIESDRCASLINASNDVSSTILEEVKAQQKVLVDLYLQLVNSYAEEDELKGNIRRFERLRLGVKLEGENIDVLQRRRASGTAQMCLELADLKNDTQPMLATRARTGDTIILILEGQLRLLGNGLAEARNENRDLQRKLEEAKSKCSRTINDLTVTMQELTNNKKRGLENVEKTKRKLQVEQSRVEELRRLAGANRRDHEEWEQEAKKILDKYQEYSVDVKCYEMLHRGLVSARPRLSERLLNKASAT